MKQSDTSHSPTQQAAAGHTLGPWEIRGRGHNRADIWQAESAGNQQIGEVYTGGANKNNAGHANAALIAAAPELLAALRSLVASKNHGDRIQLSQWACAVAAINKAEGRA